MPCYDPPWPGDPGTKEYKEKYKGKADKLTRMLCWLCNRVPTKLIAENPELAKWWQEHMAFDKKRGARR